jgi:hypothetical protein
VSYTIDILGIKRPEQENVAKIRVYGTLSSIPLLSYMAW